MYESFTARNFRCFRNLTVEPLDRVNLITGTNNTGKTSLLEALFLHAGWDNPELSSVIDAIRGIQKVDARPEAVWGWLFFENRLKDTIELTARLQDGREPLLRISLRSSGPQETGAGAENGTAAGAAGLATTAMRQRDRRLEYQYRESPDSVRTFEGSLTRDGTITTNYDDVSHQCLGVYLSSRARTPKEDAELFSRLEAVGREHEAVNIMQILEPRLKRLAVLLGAGLPMIHGDLGIGKLIPLPLMGEGMVRLLSIALAILDARGGTVLVDEIENGLHHSVMQQVWRAIACAARESDAQIFATTHSWECICAAHEAFESDRVYDFRLHRLDRLDDGIHAITYDRESLDAAIAAGLEVR